MGVGGCQARAVGGYGGEAFARNEKMAYMQRGGGSLDWYRAAENGVSTDSSRDFSGHAIAARQSAATIGRGFRYGRAPGARWVALALGWNGSPLGELFPKSSDLTGPAPLWFGFRLVATGFGAQLYNGAEGRWQPAGMEEEPRGTSQPVKFVRLPRHVGPAWSGNQLGSYLRRQLSQSGLEKGRFVMGLGQ